MHLMSFDIGIKNMAYCIFDVSAGKISCPAWKVMNLVAPPPTDAASASTSVCTSCQRKAKFRKGNAFFCEIHTKHAERIENGGFKRPCREWSLPAFRKMKVDELRQLLQTLPTSEVALPTSEVPKKTKEACIADLQQWMERTVLEPVVKPPKPTSASDADLIQVGRQLCLQLDAALLDTPHMDHVIIENQISPLAARMRTLQGMLTQYFILRQPNAQIHYVSSSMKLKEFAASAAAAAVVTPATTLAQKYKKHKVDGVAACGSMLRANPSIGFTAAMLITHAKKDDLADCWLQAMWFLKHVVKKINWSAEDLNIKCVDE